MNRDICGSHQINALEFDHLVKLFSGLSTESSDTLRSEIILTGEYGLSPQSNLSQIA